MCTYYLPSIEAKDCCRQREQYEQRARGERKHGSYKELRDSGLLNIESQQSRDMARKRNRDQIMPFFFLKIKKKLNYLIYLFLAVLALCCCVWPFSSCGERGATLHCDARASHCSVFSCCRAWALGAWASVVAARGFSSCGSWGLERRLSSCGARA